MRDAERLSKILLQLATDRRDDDGKQLSMRTRFPYVSKAFPSRMIMPLQSALTLTLPSSADALKNHDPFPQDLVEIKGDTCASSTR